MINQLLILARMENATTPGLSISQRAVEVHGGRISARNSRKGGLLVTNLLVTILLPGAFQTSNPKIEAC